MQIDTSKTHLSYNDTHRTMRIQTAILGVTKLHRANIYAVGQTFVHETLYSSTGINTTDILFVV